MAKDAAGHGLAYRLYHGETSYNFIDHMKRWFILSGIVIAIGLVSLSVRGLNFGIDFRGGTSWEVRTTEMSVTEARNALRDLGMGDAQIQKVGGETIRVRADIGEGGTSAERQARQQEVTDKLVTAAKVEREDISVNDVGPSWGNEISNKARRALIFFFAAIFLYISFRFEWKMALAGIAAVVHDIFVTVGVYSLSGFEVTPATIIAFLTILGYSLYDTIVVFDKVEENTRGLAASGRMTYRDTVNISMNQVLMRSLNTSLVAILPILSILVVGAYIMGATTLQDFGLALLIGLLTGAYSSIYIAAPVLALLKEREPRYAAIRQRLASRPAGAPPLTPAAAAAMSGPSGGAARPVGVDDHTREVIGRTPSVMPQGGGARRPPPRGRKRGRRR